MLYFLIIMCYILYLYICIFLRRFLVLDIFFHKFNQFIGVIYISNNLNNLKIKNIFLDYIYNYEYFIH